MKLRAERIRPGHQATIREAQHIEMKTKKQKKKHTHTMDPLFLYSLIITPQTNRG